MGVGERKGGAEGVVQKGIKPGIKITEEKI